MNAKENVPFFSIIVPVYNVEKYVRKCIDSIRVQSFGNFECILIDDGSTDGSSQICDEYAGQDKRIRVYHKQNGGLSDARNVGITNAQGEFLVFVDSDDYLVNSDCLRGVNDFLSGRDCKLCLLNCAISSEKPLKCFQIDNDSVVKYDFMNNVIKNKYPHLCAWSWVCKRDYVLKNNLFFVKGLLHEDEEWMPRLLASLDSNDVVLVYNSFFYFYRVNREGAITYSIKPKNVTDKITIIDQMHCRANQRDGIEKVFLNTRAAQIMMGLLISQKDFLNNNIELKNEILVRKKYLWMSKRLVHKILYILLLCKVVK